MARVTQQNLRDADLTFTWKLILRVFSIILAAIATGLIAWAELHYVAPNFGLDNGGGTYDDGYAQSFWDSGDNFLLPWEHISLGLSIIWNLANIGVWFTPSRSGRGMHPGANVGCDLILWIILLLTGVFASFAASDYLSPFNEYSLDYDGGNQCSPFFSCDDAADYTRGLTHKGVVIAVGVAFTFLVMIAHFALFISACRYTHARRYEKGGRYARAVTEEATVIATKMVRDMGYQPPGQWPTQQPPQPQWWPQGEQQSTGAPMVHPDSLQPKSEASPVDREVQDGYQQQQEIETQQQHRLSKGKGREENLELGYGDSSMAPGGGPIEHHPESGIVR